MRFIDLSVYASRFRCGGWVKRARRSAKLDILDLHGRRMISRNERERCVLYGNPLKFTFVQLFHFTFLHVRFCRSPKTLKHSNSGSIFS